MPHIDDDRAVAGSHSGHRVWSRLVRVTPEVFAADYWGRRALLSSAEDLGGGGFADLLNAEAVDELLSERGLRTPFLRVAKAGATLGDSAFTSAGGVGAGIGDQVRDDRLTRLFADGSTLVLQALHRTWPPVIALCQELAGVLGHPVQANAYVTPPQNQGFSDHYDVHDVFVLQISGEKRWSIHEPVLESPLRDQPWSDRRNAVARRAAEPPVIEATLRPGDCLYLPRGFLHAAKALGGISTHLTIGIHTWTGQHLAEQLMQQALRRVAQDATVRASLPMGADFTGRSLDEEVERIRGALIDALRAVDAGSLDAALLRRSRDSQRAAPIGPLAQFEAARSLTGQTPVRLRPHLAATLDERPGQDPVLRSRADDLVVPAADADAVRLLLDGSPRPADRIGLELARRLLLAGVAVVG